MGRSWLCYYNPYKWWHWLSSALIARPLLQITPQLQYHCSRHFENSRVDGKTLQCPKHKFPLWHICASVLYIINAFNYRNYGRAGGKNYCRWSPLFYCIYCGFLSIIAPEVVTMLRWRKWWWMVCPGKMCHGVGTACADTDSSDHLSLCVISIYYYY